MANTIYKLVTNVPRGGQFDDDGQRWDHRRGQPDANDKAQRREEQPLAVRDEAIQCGADAADEGAYNDRCFPSPGIGKRAKCKGADDRTDAAAVEDRR